LQADLAHLARVNTLGELNTSLAHELNQPLAGLVSSGGACLSWLDRQPPDIEKAKKSAERSIRNANRTSEVIERVRALSKKGAPQKAPLDINDVLNEVIPLVEREISSHKVSLRMKLAPDLPSVLADRIQLPQMIINLLINGIEAIATGRGSAARASGPIARGSSRSSTSNSKGLRCRDLS